ncbi:MAG: hormogonium polysaccharide secretion pseudopilin HpsC [Coleofasciculus sp.]|uniref:hormogonium polysaccharide secretion pseudopilin HpsC n=1 Tax=Coleofasciculus sp. TaxID=3100458 RepID=UPI003A22DF04
MNTLKFLLLNQLKHSQPTRKTAGFTLIELLVALIMAALIITPVLGFMINLLQTDRQEQAKSTSEQELQAAADYIARDLQQAVYIYDQQALNNDLDLDNPENSGIRDQLPSVTNGTPVLVFWKRERVPEAVPIDTSTNCATADQDIRANNCDDTFVYSLVAYYLITADNPTWSDAARIGRWEISDGVRRPPYIPGTNTYLNDNQSRKTRDQGFALFNLGLSGPLRDKMNRWDGRTTPATNNPDNDDNDENYNNTPQVLVDYIDHSTTNLPPRQNCSSFNPTGFTPTPEDPGWTQVPDYDQVDAPFQTNSFYACVRSAQNIARVYLRGNALARIRSAEEAKYSEDGSSYFPTASIEVKGIGGLSRGN